MLGPENGQFSGAISSQDGLRSQGFDGSPDLFTTDLAGSTISPVKVGSLMHDTISAASETLANPSAVDDSEATDVIRKRVQLLFEEDRIPVPPEFTDVYTRPFTSTSPDVLRVSKDNVTDASKKPTQSP